MATTPEGTTHTGIARRLRDRKRARKKRRRSSITLTSAGEAISFLTPIRSTPERRGLFPNLTLEEYVTIVDRMGRVARSGKSGKLGRIPEDLPPILERLDLEAKTLAGQIVETTQFFGSVIGKAASCAAEAIRCNRNRVISAMQLDAC